VGSTTRLSGVASALHLGDHSLVALVGGGGKSTLLHALGHQLTGRVVLTTTTKMGADQHGGRPVLIDPADDEVSAATGSGPVMVWSRVTGHKAIGVAPSRCDAWFRLADHVVVEADGSRRQPFKAPAELEPVVPTGATTVVSVIGADALGKVIADRCHRPLRVAALAGCDPGRRLDPESAARVLVHERGMRRAVPAGAELVVAITRVDASNELLVDRLVGELYALCPDLRVVAVAAIA
jgi:probable selenium-dependent hydroxylase accessory protein YqeC